MPNLVPSYNTKRVFATWVRQAGTELRPGTYKVTVPVRVTNATDDVIIPAGVWASGSLNVTPGVPSLDILAPCNDDPDNFPNGWQPIIEITFTDAPGEKYLIDVPVAGPDINLRTILLLETIPVPQSVLIRGVPGGLAELDNTGKVPDTQLPDGIGGGIPVGADLDDIIDSATRLAMTTTERTKITDLPTAAALTSSFGEVIHTTGAETKAGVLTLSSIPVLPGTDPTTANQATRKAWVEAQIAAAVAALLNSAPGALDTLDELAAAFGDDANFATTITNALALKATLASPAFTGNPTAPTPAASDNDTSVATTAFVKTNIAPSADADNLISVGTDGKPFVDGSGIQPAGTYLGPTALDGVLFGWVLEVGQTAANVPAWLPVSTATNKTIIARKL